MATIASTTPEIITYIRQQKIGWLLNPDVVVCDLPLPLLFFFFLFLLFPQPNASPGSEQPSPDRHGIITWRSPLYYTSWAPLPSLLHFPSIRIRWSSPFFCDLERKQIAFWKQKRDSFMQNFWNFVKRWEFDEQKRKKKLTLGWEICIDEQVKDKRMGWVNGEGWSPKLRRPRTVRWTAPSYWLPKGHIGKTLWMVTSITPVAGTSAISITGLSVLLLFSFMYCRLNLPWKVLAWICSLLVLLPLRSSPFP